MGLFDGQPFSMERAADNMMSPLGLAAQNLARFDSGGIDMGAAAGRAQMYHQDKANQTKTRQYLEMNRPDLLPLLDSGASPAQLLGQAFGEAQQQKKDEAARQQREQLAQFITDPAARQAFLADEMDFGTARQGAPVPEPIKVGAGDTLFDPVTREPIFQAPQDPSKAFSNERDLASQYGQQDPVKTYQAVRNSYERVRSSAELGNSNTNGSGAADISLVFAYMKMLDPGSVVREGEFASAAQAGGVPANVLNMYNNLLKGDKLTPDVRQQFVQSADTIYQDVTQNLSSANDQFTTRAQGWNVDPNNFIIQPEQYDPFGAAAAGSGGIDDLLTKYGAP